MTITFNTAATTDYPIERLTKIFKQWDKLDEMETSLKLHKFKVSAASLERKLRTIAKELGVDDLSALPWSRLLGAKRVQPFNAEQFVALFDHLQLSAEDKAALEEKAHKLRKLDFYISIALDGDEQGREV
jgi:hypothetical protein